MFITSLVEKSKPAFQSEAFIVASAIGNVPPELSVWEYLEWTLQNWLHQPQIAKLSLLRVRAKEQQTLDSENPNINVFSSSLMAGFPYSPIQTLEGFSSISSTGFLT